MFVFVSLFFGVGGVDVRNFMTSFYTKLNETKSYHSTLFPFLLTKFSRSLTNPLKPSSSKKSFWTPFAMFFIARTHRLIL